MKVISIGITMGLVVPLMVMLPYMPRINLHTPALEILGMHLQFDIHVRTLAVMFMMILLGALSGFFVVPMNALLQHRGHVLMGAGHSIAVQNFNENLSILVMTFLYFLLGWLGVSVNITIVAFGLFVAGIMYLIKLRHLRNQAEHDDLALLEDHPH
jgi:hypothetical protein